ncbi:MAG: hypothetical protein R3A10_14905 [Caldilineaceae bacterium]
MLPVDINSKLTVFEGVFADIGDEQSIEQSLSTFSSHMTNIIAILEDATPTVWSCWTSWARAPIPMKAFSAYCMALLENLRDVGINTLPRPITATWKLYAAHSTPGVRSNASVEFDVRRSARPTS